MKELYKYIKGDIPIHFKINTKGEPYSYYRLLSISLKPPFRIADLGTYQGLSALALSANEKIKVRSYDIDLRYNIVKKKKNIRFIEDNIFNRIDEIIKCNLILVDLDPHDGIQEQKLFDILIEKEYKGMTIWDDINKNLGMKNFWHKVNLKKEDVTVLGHYTGTGLIYF